MANLQKGHAPKCLSRPQKSEGYSQGIPLGGKPMGKVCTLRFSPTVQNFGDTNIESRGKKSGWPWGLGRHGIACGLCDKDPAAHLGDALASPVVTHRAAILDPAAFGRLLRDIDAFTGTPLVRLGMQLLPHIMTRPGEMRLGKWAEINWEERIWQIPAERTKLRRVHAIPLSRQVIELLRELERHSGGLERMFPAQTSHLKFMSENSINQALRRMGYGPEIMTAHGFRSTAPTLLNQSGKWHPDAIERALAHGDSNAIRGIYNRGNYWDERVKMAQWWSDHLDQLKRGAKVVGLKAG